MAKRMTWRKQPNERGLASVGQVPRGKILKRDGEDIAHVYPSMEGWSRHTVKGWYFVARSDRQGIPLMNSSTEPAESMGMAMEQCRAYVDKCLAEKEDV